MNQPSHHDPQSTPIQDVAFRPLAIADLPTLQQWLSDDEVAAWWRTDDLSLQAITDKYSPRIHGEDPVRAFVILIEGQAAGFIQAYRIEDPDYARQIAVSVGAVATDLLIGNAHLRGRGWGRPVMLAFLRQVVFGDFQADLAVIAPSPSNLRAIHVYQRSGFNWLRTVKVVDSEDPLDGEEEYVMTLSRDVFESTTSEPSLSSQ